MPTVFEAYASYENDIVAMYKKHIRNISIEMLRIAESIPKERLANYFVNNPSREELFMSPYDSRNKSMVVDERGATGLGEYVYDKSVFEAFEKFLKKTYRFKNIFVENSCSINMKLKTISISFGIKTEFAESDFNKRSIIPDAKKKVIDNIVCVMIEDLSLVVDRPFAEHEVLVDKHPKYNKVVEVNFSIDFNIDNLVEELNDCV